MPPPRPVLQQHLPTLTLSMLIKGFFFFFSALMRIHLSTFYLYEKVKVGRI